MNQNTPFFKRISIVRINLINPNQNTFKNIILIYGFASGFDTTAGNHRACNGRNKINNNKNFLRFPPRIHAKESLTQLLLLKLCLYNIHTNEFETLIKG